MSRKKDAYTVGYGKPPEGTKFKKGKSGNPRGARQFGFLRRHDDRDAFVEELLKPVSVKVNGKTRKIAPAVAIAKVLKRQCLEGDHKAILLFGQLTKWQLESWQTTRAREVRRKRLVDEFLKDGEDWLRENPPSSEPPKEPSDERGS